MLAKRVRRVSTMTVRRRIRERNEEANTNTGATHIGPIVNRGGSVT